MAKATKLKRAATSGPTRRERVESKESAIVAAAYEMFATKGFAKSTISEIAKAAGVAEGTVYLYFNNKEALAGGVIASFYDRLTEDAQEGVNQLETTEEKLHFLASHHLKNVIEEQRILELLSIVDRSVKSNAGGAVYKMNKRYVSIFDNVIRDGVWRGDIEEGFTPWVLRDIFYGGLEYAMRTILITDRHQEMERFTRELVRLVIAKKAEKPASQGSASDAKMAKLAKRLEGVADRLEEALPSFVEGEQRGR